MSPMLAALPLALLLALDPSPARVAYDRDLSARLVPLLLEAIRFPTVEGNAKAHADQKAWLSHVGKELGFTVRDAGLVTEVELPATRGAGEGVPVLGLVVHGDVQPAEASRWKTPPFAGVVRDGHVLGRGAADDKGPLVQALLAMKALEASGLPRTHTVRLLVGSDEESANLDIASYLKTHAAPDASLVLDASFPVVAGEKAWNALAVTAELAERTGGAKDAAPFVVADLSAGISPSIVPDEARLVLKWRSGKPRWDPLVKRLRAKRLPDGTRLSARPEGHTLTVTVTGRSAHGGMNLEGGRNALVALAVALEGELPPGGAGDLLAFARLAGRDLHGTGFGLTDDDPLWGRYLVNVATVQAKPFPSRPGAPEDRNRRTLVIVLRRPPPLTGPQLRARLEGIVTDFNARTGASLAAGGWYEDEPLVVDPEARLVKRLLAIYARSTGETARPAVLGGGTYAKRIPNSVVFGMWFPGAPYPGHDVDEKIPIADLHRGTRILIEALVDLATGEPLTDPLKP